MEQLIRQSDDVATVKWLGRNLWQYPLDAWLLQEMVSELRPDLIIETGTHEGSSALYLATICDLLGHGEIITIDIDAKATPPHPRVTYVAGSSVDFEVIDQVAARAAGAETVLVMLDSDHSADHVFQELRQYGSFVTAGSYIHVQDGVIDEVALVGPGPGPKVAAQRFLASDEGKKFRRDLDVEQRYVMTAHPFGWLKRT